MTLDFNEIYTTLKPLIIFILAMSAYSIFIFKFYRFLAKKDIIELNLKKKYSRGKHYLTKKFFSIGLYTLEFIILLPVFIFFWFAVLATLLIFLTKGGSVETILLVAMAVVGTVRVTSYYNEDLSKDLAKMLPFALLGVLLIDISFFDLESSLSLVDNITLHLELMMYYLGFIIVLEIIARGIYNLLKMIFEFDKEEELIVNQ
jgi:hypothetical protein